MPARLTDRTISWLDGAFAKLGDAFIREWGKVERSYRRPLSAWCSLAPQFYFSISPR